VVTVTKTADDGRSVTGAAVGALELYRLLFPPAFRHGVVDPPRGYLAVVLEGAVRKSFRRTSSTLDCGSFASIPAGASHSSVFAAAGCEVLVIRPSNDDGAQLFGRLLVELRRVDASAATHLGRRIAGELGATDSCSALALEGLALELIASVGRATAQPRNDRGTAWLHTVRELLDASVPGLPCLQELAAAVGRHPAHLARVFRREYGVTVADYARLRRLEWATAKIASTDAPLARIALDAGFADQSHFTRAFRRHHGVTPGRYRKLVRA
jgi:AraC family transcriptional regulator